MHWTRSTAPVRLLTPQLVHRVPSAPTYLVQKRERDLDVALLDRSGRRAKLTRAGRVVVEEGRRLLHAAEQLERKAQRAQQGRETEVRVCIAAILPFDMMWSYAHAFYMRRTRGGYAPGLHRGTRDRARQACRAESHRHARHDPLLYRVARRRSRARVTLVGRTAWSRGPRRPVHHCCAFCSRPPRARRTPCGTGAQRDTEGSPVRPARQVRKQSSASGNASAQNAAYR
ncbi:LysR family transcriptional regulator [Burkholderia cenocepacia]|nr:putative transcriptional regulator [Burkholderia cepacia]CAB5141102.1 LysR family transcriptional regulator [Burkholderia cenocepacia]CAB5143019.1 LysR family transcriptional regulator [Burkholderia cenocepacia]CAB5143769.1 LysR family transcriptional regulator [Burkholderia cenocepacia]CAB5144105.1 LysR family transcriptional regulator [Burkholderia cenocepacia]